MFCKMCGQQLEDNAAVCSKCGHETGVAATKVEQTVYCKKCGRNIGADKAFCPYCGTQRGVEVASSEPAVQQAAPQQQSAPVTVNVTNNVASDDAPNMGFAILGFFFPLIGLILWLIWKDQTPLKAKSCGKGALIGFIVSIVAGVVPYIFYFVVLLAAEGLVGLPLLLL